MKWARVLNIPLQDIGDRVLDTSEDAREHLSASGRLPVLWAQVDMRYGVLQLAFDVGDGVKTAWAMQCLEWTVDWRPEE